MRVPIRKPGQYTHLKPDANMTAEKYRQLKTDLEKWKKVVRPRLAAEVKRLALMGDFSENAAYQIAKGRLRGLNQRILDTEDLLKRADIIEHHPGGQTVQLGHKVTVESAGVRKIYLILGSSETDPARGIISHKSPLGSALLGKREGMELRVELKSRVATYRIIKIE
jgi:transcription elongation GreA/GreB family factor